MSFTARGARLLESLKHYKNSFARWDTKQVLEKVNIESIGDGQIKGSFVVEEKQCNLIGTLHGGYIASIVDVFSVFSYVSHPKGQLAYTTDMHLSFLGVAVIGDVVQVESMPLKVSKSSALIDCILSNKSNGKILARGTTNLLYIENHPHEHVAKKNFPFDFSDKPKDSIINST